MKVNDLRIEDVCEFVGGSQPPKSEFVSTPKDGYIRLIQIRDYKSDTFPTYIPTDSTKKFCDENDIMIGRYGPPIFQICRGLTGAYNVALLKAKPKQNIDREYLYYFLKQDTVFQYVDKLSARTGGQTGVDLVSLNKYPICLPEEIQDQKKLVSVLSALDAKIDCNNRINAELEVMAKTLYDYWFVQFDFPDANGNPYKSSGGKMDYNATLKREIPAGWEARKIDKVALIKAGGDKPKNFSLFCSNEYPIPIFSNGISDEGLYGYTDKSTIQQPSITVSARGTIGYSVLRLKPFAPIIRLLVLTPLEKSALKYIEETVKRLGFDNSGSVQQQLTAPQISGINILYPSSNVLDSYSKIVTPIVKKLESLKEQSKELGNLRDWLLPMLMNGQVTVN